MTVTATYDSGDIEVVFTAETERSDYGVPNSPVWDEVNVDTIEIMYLTILGVEVDPRQLPKDLLDAIDCLSAEVGFE
jgi:hypothetical protein